MPSASVRRSSSLTFCRIQSSVPCLQFPSSPSFEFTYFLQNSIVSPMPSASVVSVVQIYLHSAEFNCQSHTFSFHRLRRSSSLTNYRIQSSVPCLQLPSIVQIYLQAAE